jgi:hypothetical protein
MSADRAWEEALAAMQRVWRGLPPIEPARDEPPATSAERAQRVTAEERRRRERERLRADRARRKGTA